MPHTQGLSSLSDQFDPYVPILSRHGFSGRRAYDQEKIRINPRGERTIVSVVLRISYQFENAIAAHLRKIDAPLIAGNYVSLDTVWDSDEDLDYPLTPEILDGVLARLADFEAGVS